MCADERGDGEEGRFCGEAAILTTNCRSAAAAILVPWQRPGDPPGDSRDAELRSGARTDGREPRQPWEHRADLPAQPPVELPELVVLTGGSQIEIS